MLGAHLALAVTSLLRENPTVDEVAHLPAGITYWQKGTFRLYPQNPPLVKLAAALPVVLAGPKMDRIYELPSWTSNPPIHGSIAHEFAYENAERYFDLFARARLVIPWFSVLGGLVVFAWSRRLYGVGGGLLSLALWCFCPNVLAHARLVTTDVGATALGVLATFTFWRWLKAPSVGRAGLSGFVLGLAILAKFSNLLLLGAWPLIWLAAEAASGRFPPLGRLARALGHAVTLLVVCLLTINAGYGFEGTGRPLKTFEFASGSLTRLARRPPIDVGHELLKLVWQHRVNRFRGTWLGEVPVPLPEYFLIGFDLQKLDAEGVPRWFVDPAAPRDEIIGYPVYLDGERRDSGWWYYYLAALGYKVPEGTWALGLASLVVLAARRRTAAAWADEFALLLVPSAVLLAMSFGTDINLGLRYVLPAFPYVFVSIGKLVPWAVSLTGRARGLANGFVVVAVLETIIAALMIHPHYLAYFNWASGGAERGSEHLIDSNIDWGQDLVNLRDWMQAHAPGERVGLAYFGQLNPNVLARSGEGLNWFLAPWLPGAASPLWGLERLDGPPPRLVPGLYAVSASFLRGLPYALYDPSPRVPNAYPAWDTRQPKVPGREAYGYFRELTPIDHVGHSILIFRVSPEDAARLAPLWDAR